MVSLQEEPTETGGVAPVYDSSDCSTPGVKQIQQKSRNIIGRTANVLEFIVTP
jgi:hypothetical protein